MGIIKKIKEWDEWRFLELIYLIPIGIILISIGMISLARVSVDSIYYLAKDILLILGAIGIMIIVVFFGIIMLSFYQKYVKIQKENEELSKKIVAFDEELKRLKGKKI